MDDENDANVEPDPDAKHAREAGTNDDGDPWRDIALWLNREDRVVLDRVSAVVRSTGTLYTTNFDSAIESWQTIGKPLTATDLSGVGVWKLHGALDALSVPKLVFTERQYEEATQTWQLLKVWASNRQPAPAEAPSVPDTPMSTADIEQLVWRLLLVVVALCGLGASFSLAPAHKAEAVLGLLATVVALIEIGEKAGFSGPQS